MQNVALGKGLPNPRLDREGYFRLAVAFTLAAPTVLGVSSEVRSGSWGTANRRMQSEMQVATEQTASRAHRTTHPQRIRLTKPASDPSGWSIGMQFDKSHQNLPLSMQEEGPWSLSCSHPVRSKSFHPIHNCFSMTKRPITSSSWHLLFALRT